MSSVPKKADKLNLSLWIDFNFTDIIHLVSPIHDTGNGPCSSLNMHILTQLLIFTFWSFLTPYFKLEPSNLVQLAH